MAGTSGSTRLLLVLASIAVAFAAADTYVVVLALTEMMGTAKIPISELQRAAPIISGFLLGYVAIKAGTQPVGLDGRVNPQLVIPQLFEDSFPAWFAGVAFAAIAIGALVPAAIMSIAASNTFTRNIYKEWINPRATEKQEAKVSKLMSLVVKAFALVFVFTLDKQNAINFQLLGGIWIMQTFPSIVFYLYTRWFHRRALLAGWAVGMVYGTVTAYNVINPVTKAHFGGSVAAIPGLEQMGYIALTAFALNLIVAVVFTFVFRAFKASEGHDETIPADYFADTGDPRIDKTGSASPVTPSAH